VHRFLVQEAQRRTPRSARSGTMLPGYPRDPRSVRRDRRVPCPPRSASGPGPKLGSRWNSARSAWPHRAGLGQRNAQRLCPSRCGRRHRGFAPGREGCPGPCAPAPAPRPARRASRPRGLETLSRLGRQLAGRRQRAGGGSLKPGPVLASPPSPPAAAAQPGRGRLAWPLRRAGAPQPGPARQFYSPAVTESWERRAPAR